MNELTITINKTVDDRFYFRFRLEDGRILLTSKEYVRVEKCMNEIYAIQQYPEIKFSEEYHEDNGYQYTLIDSWGRIVVESPYYLYSSEMRNDIKTIKKLVSKAAVIDKSRMVRFFRPVRIK